MSPTTTSGCRVGAKPRKRLSAAQKDKIIAASVVEENMRRFARDQVRRELAAWLMGARANMENLLQEIHRVTAECADESSLLHGLIPDEALATITRAGRELGYATTELCGVHFEVPLPDVSAVAKGYQSSWGL